MPQKIIVLFEILFASMLIVILAVGFYHVIRLQPATPKHAITESKAIKPAPKPVKPFSLPSGYKASNWVIAFEDTFDNPVLNSSKWVTCYEWYDYDNQGCTNSGNNELEWYTRDQVKVENGSLLLKAENKPVTVRINGKERVYPYSSGMVSTGRSNMQGNVKWEGQYGYYEIRMRTQAGQGLWPAFWLLPTDKHWPPEIDIMELLGHKPNEVLQTYHWEDAAGNHQEDSAVISKGNFTNGWHTYAIDWQPGKITWFIDSIVSRTVKNENIPKEPMQIIINQAVGGKLPGSPNATTQFPATTEVDYVRVLAKKQ